VVVLLRCATVGIATEGANISAQRATFDKLQRERAKKAKAQIKRERRFDKDTTAADSQRAPEPARAGGPSASQLLEMIEQLHQRFENHQIGFEEFEVAKADLLARLPVE
jgi:hypothetical protein